MIIHADRGIIEAGRLASFAWLGRMWVLRILSWQVAGIGRRMTFGMADEL